MPAGDVGELGADLVVAVAEGFFGDEPAAAEAVAGARAGEVDLQRAVVAFGEGDGDIGGGAVGKGIRKS
jgi:hypothetical protein